MGVAPGAAGVDVGVGLDETGVGLGVATTPATSVGTDVGVSVGTPGTGVDVGVVGVVTVSGLPQADDHALVVEALERFLGPP